MIPIAVWALVRVLWGLGLALLLEAAGGLHLLLRRLPARHPGRA